MYNCKRFEMYSMSLSSLFGISPKISYICGKCNGYNETRIPLEAVELGRPYSKCEICGAINKIPIRIEE